MISALATTATSSASSAAPLRSREQESVNPVDAPEASAVVTLSAAGASLAAREAASPPVGAKTSARTGATPVPATPAAADTVAATGDTNAAVAAVSVNAGAQTAPGAGATGSAAPDSAAQETPTFTGPARAAAPAASSGSAGGASSSSSTATATSDLSLVPNLIYAPADSNEDGVISAAEQKAYDLEQFPEGVERKAAPVPPRISQELREYEAVSRGGD